MSYQKPHYQPPSKPQTAQNLTLNEMSKTYDSFSNKKLSVSHRDPINYQLLDNIEREINDALYCFQVERNKQHGVLKQMRNELQIIKDSPPKIKNSPSPSSRLAPYPTLAQSASSRQIHTQYQTSKPKTMKITNEENFKIDQYKTLQNIRLENTQLVTKLNKQKAKTKNLKQKLADNLLERDKLGEIIKNYEIELKDLRKELDFIKKPIDELTFVKEELKKVKNELNEKIIENNILKKDIDLLRQTNSGINSKQKIIDILSLGATEYDYLKNIDFDKESIETLLEENYRLVDYLLKEKRETDIKYSKLLELHNKLIEINTKGNEQYNEAYLYNIADENERLKSELEKLKENRLYFANYKNKP